MTTAHLCPYCQTPLGAGSPVKPCPVCDATHHPECFEENGGCAIPACAGGPEESARPPLIVEPVSVASSQVTSQADGSLPRVNWPEGVPVPLDPGRGSSSDSAGLLIAAAIVAVIAIVVIIVVVIAGGTSSEYGSLPFPGGSEYAWVEPGVMPWM